MQINHVIKTDQWRSAPQIHPALHFVVFPSQCSTLVLVYTVVRAMYQVNGRESFSASWGSETPEPIHLKCRLFHHVRLPSSDYTYKIRWPPQVGVGCMGSSGFSFTAPKPCFDSGCVFLWGSVCSGVKSFTLLLRKPSYNEPNNAIT